MPRLEHTSVPLWAVPEGAAPAAPDATGTSYLLVGVGAEGERQVTTWADALDGAPVTVVLAEDQAAAGVRLATALASARVGVRIRVAGPVGDCLALRGVAVRAGVEDDELHLAPTSGGPVAVQCCHCGATTPSEKGIDDVVSCTGCDRRLLVYYHVSRRTGTFLGFQIDAEEAVS
ncbi:dimethylamine monooxygenase subunit DmmA family protein [Nocardioides sp. YIM 152588]|uniref:dimethylamine monooxygenase subunit DmmA family protein n=1 Tax=Nocardioides sp. YIM 152588 TaxID=3158259 RepID=UPI0032E3B920